MIEELTFWSSEDLAVLYFLLNAPACTRFVELHVDPLGHLIRDRVTGIVTLDGEDVTYLKEYLQ